MFLKMCYKLIITRQGKSLELVPDGYSLAIIDINISSSTLNLVDTAIITLPESYLNIPLKYRSRIKVGDNIEIQLGYDEIYKTEFVGYIEKIAHEKNSVKVYCIDALFLFKKSVKDIQFKAVSLLKIGQYLVEQIDPSFTVKCDYGISYEKFVIHQATGYDVLMKLQEETKANIYFNTEKKELHIHPAFVEKAGKVTYSMQKNIQSADLSYKYALDNKIQVIVESTNVNGTVTRITKGNTSKNTVNVKVGAMLKSDLEKVADNVYKSRNLDQYEGTIVTWLIPFVQSSYSAKIIDDDYPEQTSVHYVDRVDTSYSKDGGKRTISLGVRLN